MKQSRSQITVPEGRVLVLSLSGTQRTDWAVGLLLLVAAAFGLGALAGRLSVGQQRRGGR